MSCHVKALRGLLKGVVCKSYFGQTYYSFEGIPYAKPPLGKLRFRAPQELEPWDGVRDATKPGNKCAQINPYVKKKLEGSEDCLYLNVYTPRLPAENLEKLPVLFFVHGGSLLFGCGDYHRPDYLLRHNVILVTDNYRLNILGFLSLNTPEIPGNAGIKDTIMALKWVNENIEHFNGDPENITVCGESVGAFIVTSYLTSRMAEGMFSKVISHSGNLLSDHFIVEDDEEAKARNIVKIMGKEVTDPESLCEYLTNASIQDLLNANTVVELNKPPFIIGSYFLSVVEKDLDGVERFFEENPHTSIKNNRFKKVPILASVSSHEGATFVQSDKKGNICMEDNFQYFIPKRLHIKRDSFRAKKFADSLHKYYFNGNRLTQEFKSEYIDLISDASVFNDTVMFIESVSKNTNTYACTFSFDGELNTGIMKNLLLKGATHRDLVQYMFFNQNKIGRCTEKENKVVNTLCEALCNFAKTGKPTWTGQKQDWLPYTPEEKHCLNIDDEIKLISFPNFDRYQLWMDLINDE